MLMQVNFLLQAMQRTRHSTLAYFAVANLFEAFSSMVLVKSLSPSDDNICNPLTEVALLENEVTSLAADQTVCLLSPVLALTMCTIDASLTPRNYLGNCEVHDGAQSMRPV